MEEVHNPEIGLARLPYAWQDYDNRRAAAFRERHRLAEAVAGAADDWAAILRLRHWAFTHVRNGTPSFPTDDPVAVVDAALAGGTFYCTYFAYAFVAAASSMGYPARHLGIDSEHEAGTDGNHHGVADVWVNRFRKWVALDPHHDSHHELDGIPLNAEELGRHWRRQGGAGIVTRFGPQGQAVPRARRCNPGKHEICGYYWHYIDSHNDVFHRRGEKWPNPVVFPVDEERKKRIWYQGTAAKSYRHGRYENGTFLTTERYHDAYPDLNCTRLAFENHSPSPYAAPVVFGSTCIPNFSHYVARVDGGPPLRVDGVEYPWPLHSGSCALDVRAVNLAGIEGPPSRIGVRIEENRAAQPEWPAAPVTSQG